MKTQQTDSYISLFLDLLQDIVNCHVGVDGILIDATTSAMCHDAMAYAKNAVKVEGIAFLTERLPRLGKALDKSLGQDRPLEVEEDLHLDTRLPEFLWPLWSQVLDDTGTPIPKQGTPPNGGQVQAVKQLRQVLYFAYKLALPYNDEKAQKVLNSFIQTQKEIASYDFPSSLEPVLTRARRLIARVVCNIDPRDILPRHGPGAVSTGERGPEKFNFSRIYASLEAVYPFTGYFMVSPSQVADHLFWLQSRQLLETGTAKVVLVNKDSRGPRLISCEPLELQWIQQGLQRRLVDTIESHPMTSGFVNFTDQGVNRALSLQGSKDGLTATLDMKDASDRVSCELVEKLFCGTALIDGLLACRSRRTRLPDGTTVYLGTFAPMGSAVCFPVEALVFWALSVAAIMHENKLSFGKARKHVRVYGDDIICRREDYATVIRYLELANLRVNEGKCCVAGFFRESCGCDAFYGVDVTPIRLRTTWCYQSKDPSQLASYVDLSNRLWLAGYWLAATRIRRMVEDLYGPLPLLDSLVRYSDSGIAKPASSQVIGWYRPEQDRVAINSKRAISTRFNRELWRVEVYGYTIISKIERFRGNGWQKLLNSICGGATGLPDGLYTVARRSSLKRAWGPVL
jgi:hypothetical protein